jgi:membrane protein YqaA with SNARE-associated domain
MIITQKFHKKIQLLVQRLEKFAGRPWYPIIIGILAALDCFVIVIPNDGILVASCMLIPRRWAVYGLSISLGSTLGAIALSILVKTMGLPWILKFYPGIGQSEIWFMTEKFLQEYGLIVVFAVGASPLMQQPVIILAGLANIPLVSLALMFFSGRFLKFMILAYLGSHSPKLLKKIWGMKDELKDAGVKLD